MTGCPRRAGSRWRVLAHETLPGGGSGDAFHIGSHEKGPDTTVETPRRTFHARHHEFPGTEFDELVVGRWIHVEQMGTGVWWMNVAGITLDVQVDREGRPTHVLVHGPGDFDDPVPGCGYELVWSRDGAA